MKKIKIYLAGPDVFRRDAIAHLDRLKELAHNYGYQGLAPLDNVVKVEYEDLHTPKHSNLIFKANVDLIKECDVIVANIEPFRGACIDDGTAWEIGCGFALGKIIYGYTPFYNRTLPEVTEICHNMGLGNYPIVEDFNNSVNLMIADSIKDSGGKIYKTYEECLVDLVPLKHMQEKQEKYFSDVLEKEKHIMENYLDTFDDEPDSEDDFHDLK